MRNEKNSKTKLHHNEKTMEEIRTYTPEDKEYIVNALTDEGLTEDEMTFETLHPKG